MSHTDFTISVLYLLLAVSWFRGCRSVVLHCVALRCDVVLCHVAKHCDALRCCVASCCAEVSRSELNTGRGADMCLFGPESEEKWEVQWWLIGVFRSEVMRGTHRSALSSRWIHNHRRDAVQSNQS